MAQVFGCTVPRSDATESGQGKSMVDACLANHVPLFIWSSLPSSADLAVGGGNFQLLDQKSEVNTYLKVSGQPAVTLFTGAFTENLFSQRQIVYNAPGRWEIRYLIAPGHMRQPFSYIRKDMGAVAVVIIRHWSDARWQEKLTEKPIPTCSYKITGDDLAKTISEITGSTVTLPVGKITKMWTMAVKYWNYDDSIPPKILVDLGVRFHSFEDFVREARRS
ncbi:hypothetical protein DACRYDRAFT_107950 [Dacryopinax primogenitus]|uniref:NmrA-like domain-containing protein n=1 Tax=Dacryopinax primogenitus (strain DJM 731) TaxID=1858805 RepID=M5GBL3_DACPD|nr:uncharacterized protein DACRYDRAFT_107950 [Dacryopinax primogenitus]EJU01398.1 hypothetical protein DACRYDRAFT_107950 [Dacryopinax primogenitus]